MLKNNGEPMFQRDGVTPKFLFYRPTGHSARPQNKLRSAKETVFKRLKRYFSNGFVNFPFNLILGFSLNMYQNVSKMRRRT